jgi:chromosome segregation protein
MFLKSMEMYGFKSFAEKTLVKFEPGITTIIGPNGCGKSNVVDAIKWVLGEKQAKNIRGSKMEELIFSGTEERKPLSLAEVSVTIDNENRILDIDSESVTIGRRIYRDGESEYLINKTSARLKDIEKLLMDTGIGKSSYSVMEQGKMDLILSTKAEDRRYIFEEAAGISRYKLQKKESLKKLQDTGENLHRINDIIKEIEREKDIKQKQSEKTREYLTLMKQYTELDVTINAIKLFDLQKKQEKYQSDVNRLKGEREKVSAKISATSAENEKDEKEKNDIQQRLWERDKELSNYKFRLEDIDSKTDRNRELIREQEKQKESIEKKVEERNENLNALRREREKAEKTGEEIKQKIREENEKLKELNIKAGEITESIKGARKSIQDNSREIKNRDRQQKKLREDLEIVIKKLIDEIDKRKAELTGSENERQTVRNYIYESIEEIKEKLKEAAENLEEGEGSRTLELIRSINIDELWNNIVKFEGFEDGFRSILFDKTGIHARKEEIDRKIAAEIEAIDELTSENILLDKKIQDDQSELENTHRSISRAEINLSTFETDRDWIERSLNSLEYQIKDLMKQIENHRVDIGRSDSIIQNLKKEIENWERELIDFNEKSKVLVDDIRELTEKREEIEKRIVDRKNVSLKEREEIERLDNRISSTEKNLVEIMFRKNSIEEFLWTEYERKLADFNGKQLDNTMLGSFQDEMGELKKKINDLGPINNLAIEEYNDLKKRFQYYLDQKSDIEKAREDILSVIDDINKSSVEMFAETFAEIRKNFSAIFKQLFEGGEATVELTDPENVLESGIDIMVRPPGKKSKNINLLSGGERALTAIALLFATYMAKPSPFCFLDEIDAPLDDENVRRFIKMLREFSRKTQFVIVTHNKKTISIGESIYGVTMEEPGISKVLSLSMKKN